MSIYLEMLEMRTPVISPLLMEVLLRELPICAEKGLDDNQTCGYIADVYQKVMPTTITPEQARYILMHLLSEAAAVPAPSEGNDPEQPSAPMSKRTFSTHFAQFLDKLDLDDCCFVLSGFDPEKAKTMYSHHDYRLIKAMRKTWHELEMQRAQIMLEASVYGMGGSFEENDENCEHYDLRNNEYSVEELNSLLKSWH